jgi:hypothetical protein
VSWPETVKPEVSKPAHGKSGRSGAKERVLIAGGLARRQRMATGTVMCRGGEAEVSRGHSTEPRSTGQAEHDGTRDRRKVRERLRTEDSSEQLAFDLVSKGAAQADHFGGSMSAPAPTGTGTLAQGLMEAVVATDNVRPPLT